MAQIINTNIASLNAQRNLNSSQGSLQTSLTRLSSGLRINSAKDDAAGLAISERFSTQIRGMNVAMRNANDGISLAQTAEGALGEIGNNLQRIRELAVQSRNATNSDSDRQALNAEVEQLKSEIQRVAEQTQFNGTNLLDGEFGDAVFQVGANQGQTITVSGMANANIAQLGSWDEPDTVTPGTVTVTAANLTDPTDNSGGGGGFDYEATTIKVNGETINIASATGATDADARAVRLDQLAAVFNDLEGVSAEVSGTDLVITASVNVEIEDASHVANAGLTDGTIEPTVVEGETVSGFATENVLTADAADRMILAMDGALTAINSSRADLGAVQNRFESVVANLSTNSENLSASRARIMDADFAAETAELTRAQILQQAGTAMLAQANSLPQNVLSLLR